MLILNVPVEELTDTILGYLKVAYCVETAVWKPAPSYTLHGWLIEQKNYLLYRTMIPALKGNSAAGLQCKSASSQNRDLERCLSAACSQD